MLENTEIISTYTRAQATADGVLVDVSPTAQEAGFRFPVAVTSTVWESLIVPDQAAASWGNSIQGRLWDVLSVLRFSIGRHHGPTLLFKVIFTVGHKNRPGCYQKEVQLKAICGPGDTAEPVITIMLPDED